MIKGQLFTQLYDVQIHQPLIRCNLLTLPRLWGERLVKSIESKGSSTKFNVNRKRKLIAKEGRVVGEGSMTHLHDNCEVVFSYRKPYLYVSRKLAF